MLQYETGNMIYLRHFRAYKRHNSVATMIIHLLVMDVHIRTVTEMLDNDNFPYRRLSIGLCPEWLALPKSECMTWGHINNVQTCYVLNGSRGLTERGVGLLKFFLKIHMISSKVIISALVFLFWLLFKKWHHALEKSKKIQAKERSDHSTAAVC